MLRFVWKKTITLRLLASKHESKLVFKTSSLKSFAKSCLRSWNSIPLQMSNCTAQNILLRGLPWKLWDQQWMKMDRGWFWADSSNISWHFLSLYAASVFAHEEVWFYINFYSFAYNLQDWKSNEEQNKLHTLQDNYVQVWRQLSRMHLMMIVTLGILILEGIWNEK